MSYCLVSLSVYHSCYCNYICGIHVRGSNLNYLGSPNRVIEASLFSGTAQTTRPLRGFFIVGSHFLEPVTSLRFRRDQATDSKLGCLKHLKFDYQFFCNNEFKILMHTYHFEVVSTTSSLQETVNWNLAALLLTL